MCIVLEYRTEEIHRHIFFILYWQNVMVLLGTLCSERTLVLCLNSKMNMIQNIH